MKTIILLSGGYDSAALVAHALYHHHDVTAMFVDYGQATYTLERRAAHRVVNLLKVRIVERRTDTIESRADGYVPARNLVLVSMAVSYADQVGISHVMYGATRVTRAQQAQGPALLPDTGGAFERAVCKAAEVGTGDRVSVSAPLIDWTKSNIRVWLTQQDLHTKIAAATWSCWRAGSSKRPRPCGECAACLDRKVHRVDLAS